MSSPLNVSKKGRTASPRTVVVEPSLSVDLKEVRASERTPSPVHLGQRRSPRFQTGYTAKTQHSEPDRGMRLESEASETLQHDRKNVDKTQNHCVKFMVEEEIGDNEDWSPDVSHGKGSDETCTEESVCEHESPECCQVSKNDVLSVVIEKLTELVETSEREQRERAANSDSEQSSGISTPRRGGRSGSPARSNRSKLYKCPNCPCLFAVTKKQLRKKTLPICQCCEKAKNAENLHFKNVAIQVIECEICQYKATNYPSLLQHLASHPKAEIYKCVLCDYVTTTQASILAHQDTHIQASSRKYKCNSCSYSTATFSELQSHLQVHDKKGEVVLKCSECGFSCRCEDVLRNHMWKHVSPDENQVARSTEISSTITSRNTEQDRPQLYKCLLCGYICEKLCTLKAHAWRHAGEKECSYPVIEDEVSKENQTDKAADNVSRIAVGCCGEDNSVCCLGGSGDKQECKCPAINIPSTSIAALQKLTVNTGSKRGKSSRPISDMEKSQGNSNSILSPHDIQQLMQGVVDDSSSNARSYEICKLPSSAPAVVEAVDVAYLQTVQGEVEVVTTECSPEKESDTAKDGQRTEVNNDKEICQKRNLEFEGSKQESSEPDSKRVKQTTGSSSDSMAMDTEKMSSSQSVADETLSNALDSEGQRKRKPDDSDGLKDMIKKSHLASQAPVGHCEEPSQPCKLSDTVKDSNNTSTVIFELHNINKGSSSSKSAQLPSNSVICSTSSIPSTSKEMQSINTVLKETTSQPNPQVIPQGLSIQKSQNSIQGHKPSSIDRSSDTCRDPSNDSDLKQQGISESLLTVIEKFREETESSDGSAYYCPICGYKAGTSAHLKDHIKFCHISGQVTCPKCPAVFNNKSKFHTHLLSHNSKSQSENEVQMKSQGDLKMNIHSRGNPVCQNCHRVFIGINAMSTHKRSCLPSVQREGSDDDTINDSAKQFDKWECQRCPATFDKKSDWLNHFETHNTSSSAESEEVDPGCTKCLTCNREFVGTFALAIHKKSCKNKRWYGCPECDYSAPTLEDLQHHEIVHRNPYKCELCPYTSASVNGVRNHMKFHSNDKPYRCPHCDFRGAYPQSLRSHMKAHQTYTPNQSETVEQFKCKLCGYICNHLPSLKSHMWKHASDPSYNYDVVNDAINTVMDALPTQIMKLPKIGSVNVKQAGITPGSSGSTSGSSGSKTDADTPPSAPQLIMMNTSATARPKVVMVRKEPVSKERGEQNKSVGFEYGVMILKCSECDFETVSKDEMFAHVSEKHFEHG